jgi:hypothetical protein
VEPSEMIIELALPDNTFVIVEPDEDDPTWFASVSRLDDGTYEVEYRDPLHRAPPSDRRHGDHSVSAL